jgi:NADH-quinone oxidoreductase subunit N
MLAGINKKSPKYIINWTSLSQHNLLLATTFSLLLLSTAGIPPLAGFFSKFCILSSLITHDFFLIALLVILSSSVGCFYYIRLIKLFFFSSFSSNNFLFGFSSRVSELLLALFFSLTVFFLIRPTLLDNFSAYISFSLL